MEKYGNLGKYIFPYKKEVKKMNCYDILKLINSNDINDIIKLSNNKLNINSIYI